MAAPTEEKTTAPVKVEAQPARMRDPFSDLFEPFSREMGRLWGEMWPLLPRPIARPLLSEKATWAPRMDVFEKNGDFVVKAELPGVKREDIHITLQDKALIVEGERKTEHEVKEEEYYRSERAYGRFYRYLPLSFEADASKIKASFTDGVLEVRIPRPAQSQPSGRNIPISS